MADTVLVQESAPDTIETTVNYHRDTGETPYTWSGGPGSTAVQSSNSVEPHRVTMRNGRKRPGGSVLARDGFHFPPPRHQDDAISSTPTKSKRVYYPEMEALIKEESGAKRVVVFDHTLRTGDVDDREAKKIREPVQRVHNDYTEWSGPQRVRDLMRRRSGGSADAPLRHHPGVAADPPAARKPSARRSAMRAASRSRIS